MAPVVVHSLVHRISQVIQPAFSKVLYYIAFVCIYISIAIVSAINTFDDGSSAVSSGGQSGIQELSSSSLNTKTGVSAVNLINGTAVASQNNMTISGGVKANDTLAGNTRK